MRTNANTLDALILVAVLFLPTQTAAAEQDTAKRWAATLERTAAQLAAGTFTDALGPLQDVTEEMFQRLNSSAEVNRFYAMAIAQLSLAEAGTHRVESAIWHWQAAQNIDRDVSGLDLSTFGEAGRILSEYRLPPRPERCEHRPDGPPPPVVVKRREPRFPEGARRSGASGILIVHVQIDESGRVSEPQIMKPFPATLVFSTLEALREWRFEPYVVDGQPAPTTFCVTFNFKLVK
jgi:TonB family protein